MRYLGTKNFYLQTFKKLIFSGYCHSSSASASLTDLCMSIESDSPLFFIFRTTSRDKNVFLQKDKEACPFRNIEYAFSYSTRGGAKVCEEPASKLDTCIEEEKMVFQFQACPDVPGSERSGKCYWYQLVDCCSIE